MNRQSILLFQRAIRDLYLIISTFTFTDLIIKIELINPTFPLNANYIDGITKSKLHFPENEQLCSQTE